jgi:transcriptional regulator with XRE-family HTH domain
MNAINFSTDPNWGVLIKRWRVDVAGLTQVALAELLGVDPTTVSRWERGRDNPDLSTQRHLRALMEPTHCHSADCQMLAGLVAMLLEPGSETNLHTLRQLARSALDRIKREEHNAEG